MENNKKVEEVKVKVDELKMDIEVCETKNDDDDDNACEMENVDIESIPEFYEWIMIPHAYTEENKTGVTFKGDSEEYVEATKRIFKMLNKKGLKYCVNERELRVLDNATGKPIKVEVKPPKGPSGKVNVKIYNVNGQGNATMMINKMSGADLSHVKAVAFKVIKYLLDGMIDGEITDSDIDNMKCGKKLDQEMKKTDLTCNICGKTCKTLQGLNIHKSKQHKGSQDNRLPFNENANVKCEQCNFVFSNREEFDKHLIKCGKDQVDFNCELCEKSFSDINSLGDHKIDSHAVIKHFKCDYCDSEIGAKDNADALVVIQKHQETCPCKPKVVATKTWISCEFCDFVSSCDIALRRHNRDKHDATTKSTSPKPKRRKKESKDDMMEVDDFQEIEMDVSDVFKDQKGYFIDGCSEDKEVLQKRSKEQDDKVRLKEIKLREKEEAYERKKEKDASKKNHKLKENQAKMKSEKSKEKNKKKNLKKKEKYIRKFPVEGDGACGPRSFAAWIYQDPTLGPYLARNMNAQFVKHWDYWGDKFDYPFERDIGIGKQKKCENEGELLELFKNSEDGAYMWPGQEEFCLIANVLQIKI